MNALLIRLAPRLFKPSLKHASPAVRLLALRDNGLNMADLLTYLQQETDATLIQQALQQADSHPALLDMLYEADRDSPLYQALLAYWKDYAEQQFVQHRSLGLLSALKHAPSLQQLLLHVQESTLAAALLEQQPLDEAALLDICLQHRQPAVRYQAAQYITRTELLEQLQKECRNDKRVQQLARERLRQQRQLQQQALQLRERQAQLLQQLQHLPLQQDISLYTAQLQHLQQQWQNLQGEQPAADLQPLYQQLLQQAQAQLQTLQHKEQQKAAQTAMRARIQQQLAGLQQLAEQLRGNADQLNLPDIAARLQQSNEYWQQLDFSLISRELQRTFNQEQQRCQQWLSCLQTYQQHTPLLQAWLDHPDDTRLTRKLSDLLMQLKWPEGLPQPALLTQARQQLQQQRSDADKQQQQQLASCQQQLDQLQTLLDQGQTRAAGQLHQQLQKQPLPEALQPAWQQLTLQLKELNDWQGFAARDKREHLCQLMEALADDQSMDVQRKADKIHALQQEWKNLGAAAMRRDLWQRFQQASHVAYAPCKASFTQQHQLQAYNQQQRSIICQELEQLADSTLLQQMDEIALDQLLSQAHEEWHRFSEVNRQQGKQLAERFQQALQPVKQQLQQLRQQSIEQKKAIINRVQALLQEEDRQAARTECKQLQQQWRSLPKVPHRQEQALWRQLRVACDALFAPTETEQATVSKPRSVEKPAAVSAFAQTLENFWESLPDTPLNYSREALKLILLMELLAGIEGSPAEQALKMQLRIERLNQQIKQPNLPPLQEAEDLLKEWREVAASRTGELAERFIKAARRLAEQHAS